MLFFFFVKNRGLFKTDSDVHNFNVRCNYDLHISTAKLRYFKMEFFFFFCGVKFYNNLPFTLEWLSYDVNKFKSVVKRFLLTNSPIPWKNILDGNKL